MPAKSGTCVVKRPSASSGVDQVDARGAANFEVVLAIGGRQVHDPRAIARGDEVARKDAEAAGTLAEVGKKSGS